MSSHPLDTLSVLSSRPARSTACDSLHCLRHTGALQGVLVQLQATSGAALVELGRCAPEQGVHGKGEVQLLDVERVKAGLQRR